MIAGLFSAGHLKSPNVADARSCIYAACTKVYLIIYQTNILVYNIYTINTI